MRRRSVLSTLLLLVLLGKGQAFASTPVILDLHSHIWIKEGTTQFLRGDFDEPTQTDSPRSRLSSKMTRASMDPSGLRVIVVSLYSHPILSHLKSWGSAFDFSHDAFREALVRQIERAKRFAAENPNWVIAGEPGEARSALKAGKRVLILSIETAEGALDSEEDRKYFIDQEKVAIVTFMHLSPDRLGRGVALMPSLGFFNAPIEWLTAWFTKATDRETGAYVNTNGLSPFGKTVLEDLVKRKVWIDLSHSSDETQKEIISVLDRAGQPSLYTHTKLREISTTERAISKAQLERVKSTHGMVGLIPTDDMTDELRGSAWGSVEACRTGILAYAEEWARTTRALGDPAAVTLGSDFNAPLKGLAGGCDRIALSSDPTLSKFGFYRGEDLPRLFEAMASVGVNFGKDPNAAVERFLTAWEKVRGPAKTGAKGLPSKTKQSL